MNNEITVYVTNQCPFCHMLTGFLQENNIPYKEVNVERDPIAMNYVVNQTGQMGVPQTNVNGKWVVGFDPTSIMQALN